MISGEEEARAFVAARCDGAAMARIERLVAMLAVENTRQNLIAAASLNSVWQRHVADSAQLLDHVPRETTSWLDLGTGAGVPGLVISAMRPELGLVLVESRRRRVEWLSEAVEALSLPNCAIEGRRLEDVAARPADVISARAFAPLPKLIKLARRFSTSDTLWLLPKGRSAAQEVAELPESLKTGFHVEQSATDADSGIVVGRIAEGQQR
jgi:16S rRNA (guanine527-N7)-methyltransferase